MKQAVPPSTTIRPPGISLARLRAMMAVADEGSFSAAARKLGVSHSAISQQIRELEADHGVHLFDRSSGKLRASPMCLELCEIAARVQEAERSALNILERRNAAGRPRLRVGLGNSMPGIAIISAFFDRYPGVSVTVDTGSHEFVLASLLQRKIDVAVLPDVPPNARFRQVPVLRHEVVAIAKANSPLARAETLTLEQLAETPLIFRARGSSTQRVVDRAFRRAGLYPEPRLIADTRDAVYEAVATGIGIGFMWRHGTFRSDTVRRIAVAEIGRVVDEVVFALADDRNELIDMMFAVATEFSKSNPLQP